MLGHPGVQSVMVILLIRKDRDEPRKIVWRDGAQQERCRHPIIETSTGHEDGQPQAEGIDQQMPLAAFDLLDPILPALGAPISVVLTDGLSMHAALGEARAHMHQATKRRSYKP